MPKRFSKFRYWRNCTPTINVQYVKTRAEIDRGNTIDYEVKSC